MKSKTQIQISKEERIEEFLKTFTGELAQSINDDILNFYKESALIMRGPLIKEPIIQINVSKDGTKLIAILKEKTDENLERTYVEIDLLSDLYPKGTTTKKILSKYKKELKKIND